MEVDPWFNAAVVGDVRFIARNYLSNAKRTEPNPPYQTAMMKAAEMHNLSIVKLLLSHEKRMTTPEGWTALMSAAKKGFVDIVETLFPYEAGFRTLTTVSPYKPNTTALLLAATHGHDPIIRILYEKEADISGWTPLFLDAYYANFGALNAAFSNTPSLLMELTPKDNYNRTPLIYLVMHRRNSLMRHDLGRCIKLLARAQEGSQDVYGRTALMYAVLAENIDAVRYILDLTTTEVNKQTYIESDNGTIVTGKTALMLAVETQNYDMCDILSRYEVGRTTQSGVTALMLAAYTGNKAICKLLAPYEGSFTTVASTPEFPANATAATIAELYGHHDVAALLSTIEGEKQLNPPLSNMPPSPEKLRDSLLYSSLYSNRVGEQSSVRHSLVSPNTKPGATLTTFSAPSLEKSSDAPIQPIMIPVASNSMLPDTGLTAKSSYRQSIMRLSGEQPAALDDGALLLRQSNLVQSSASSTRPKSAMFLNSTAAISPSRPLTISELDEKTRHYTGPLQTKSALVDSLLRTENTKPTQRSASQSPTHLSKEQQAANLQLRIENAVLNRKLYEADRKIAELQTSNSSPHDIQTERDILTRDALQDSQHSHLWTKEEAKESAIKKVARKEVHNDVENMIKGLSTASQLGESAINSKSEPSAIALASLRIDLSNTARPQTAKSDLANTIYPILYNMQSHVIHANSTLEQKIRVVSLKLQEYEQHMQRFRSMYLAMHQSMQTKGLELSVTDLVSGSIIDVGDANFKISGLDKAPPVRSYANAGTHGTVSDQLELSQLRNKVKALEQENAVLRNQSSSAASVSTASPKYAQPDATLIQPPQHDEFILSKLEETNNRLKAIEGILIMLREPASGSGHTKVVQASDPTIAKTLTALEGEISLLKSSIYQLDGNSVVDPKAADSGSLESIEADIMNEINKNMRETRVFDEKFSQLRSKVLAYKTCVEEEKKRNETLQEHISKVTVELELTSKQLQAAQVEIQALKQAKEEEDNNNILNLRRRDEELDKLRNKLKSLDNMEHEMSQLKTENALLSNRVENLQKELSVSAAELSGRERQLSEESRSMHAMNLKYQQLAVENDALIKEKSELEKKTECLLHEYDSLQDEMKALVSKNASTEENLKILTAEMQRLHEGNHEETSVLKKRLEDMTSTLNQLEEDNKVTVLRLESDLKVSNDKLSALQAECNTTREYLGRVKGYIKGADDVINQMLGQ